MTNGTKVIVEEILDQHTDPNDLAGLFPTLARLGVDWHDIYEHSLKQSYEVLNYLPFKELYQAHQAHANRLVQQDVWGLEQQELGYDDYLFLREHHRSQELWLFYHLNPKMDIGDWNQRIKNHLDTLVPYIGKEYRGNAAIDLLMVSPGTLILYVHFPHVEFGD